MNSTSIIIQTIGVYFIISGLFVVFKRRTLAQVIKDLFDHRAVTHIIGIVMIVGGLALALSNKGVDGITTFIEIISWAILVKGIFYVFFPELMYKMVKSISKATYTLLGLTTAVVGIYLTCFIF